MAKPITWQRIRWHLNRTPLAHVVKYLRRLPLRGEIEQRRALLDELPRNTVLTQHSMELRELGYTVVTDIVDPVRLARLSAASDAKLARAHSVDVRQNTQHKDFWVRLLDEDMQDGFLKNLAPKARSPSGTGTQGQGHIPRDVERVVHETIGLV